MQLATDSTSSTLVSGYDFSSISSSQDSSYSQYKIIRRNGSVVAFMPNKISIAMTKAFIAVNGSQGAASARVREAIVSLTNDVISALIRHHPASGTFHIEDIQDQAELALMRSGEHDVARAYVLYREDRARERAKQKEKTTAETSVSILHVLENGCRTPLDTTRLLALIESSCADLGETVNGELILKATLKDLYDGVPVEEVRKSVILSARALIEKEPAYSYVTARLLLHSIRLEVLGEEVAQQEMVSRYSDYFPGFIKRGIDAELLDKRMAQFDLPRLAKTLDASRDLKFDYLGLQTLYDRYFLHVQDQRIELPQAFFMRVAMGLALSEADREARAIEFYHTLSNFDFMSSTPTLFNSGTCRSQLSSCNLSTVADNLDGIFESLEMKGVPLQLPVGVEEGFKGVVDLLTMKAFLFDGDTGKFSTTEIPDDLKMASEELRIQLVESVAETDDA